jgi:exosortase A
MLERVNAYGLEREGGAAYSEVLRKSGRAWRGYVAVLLTAVALVLMLFWETAVSLVSIWWRSETFAHGFLIVPISLYMIWSRRSQLAQLTPRPNWWGPVLLIGVGFIWLLAHVADVLVVQQLVLVAIFPALVISLLGWRITWEMAFPLAYLIFAVPMGEGLIPPMMDYTAAFTTEALQLTGIPVYREGTFFSIPSGSWSVVEGCSGVRYLIASIALGCLYAYLSYRSYWRRAAFIALAVLFPIIANGLRAYMIVMIAHLSDKKLALGVDHYIYGWVFFGLVMLLMFWIGSFWCEYSTSSTADHLEREDDGKAATLPNAKPAAVILASLLALTLWPAAAHYLHSSFAVKARQVVLKTPEQGTAWHTENEPLVNWSPRYIGMDTSVLQTYGQNGSKVGLYLAYYRRQAQGAELINSQNVLVIQKHPVWQQPHQDKITVRLRGEAYEVFESQLRSHRQRLLVWHWYWVAGRYTANAYVAKFFEALARLTGNRRDGAGIVVFTSIDADVEGARETLQSFVDSMLPAIEASLFEAARS